MNKPAPISSHNESVTCAATNPFREPTDVLPAIDPTSSFRVPASVGRVDCSAGTNPKTIPVSKETAKLKARIRKSGMVEMEAGTISAGRNPINTRSIHTASPTRSGPQDGQHQ